MSGPRRTQAGAGNSSTSDGRRSKSSSRTPRPRKRESDILIAAAQIFRRQGYADTSVQDVADAVGILKGSLYYYIDSKEDLLFRVLSEVHEDAKDILEQVSELDVAPLDRLYEYIRRHVEYNSRNMDKIAVYYHDFGLLSENRRRVILEQRTVYEDFVAGLIREAQERGDVEEQVDSALATRFILSGVNWIYSWYEPNGRVGAAQLGELYAELAIKGLARRRAEAGKE